VLQTFTFFPDGDFWPISVAIALTIAAAVFVVVATTAVSIAVVIAAAVVIDDCCQPLPLLPASGAAAASTTATTTTTGIEKAVQKRKRLIPMLKTKGSSKAQKFGFAPYLCPT